MKIAMTHVDLPSEARGGVAYQVHYLANTLVERGHDVTVFTFSPAPDDARYKLHRYSIDRRLKKFHSFLLAYKLARTDFGGFDVLHTHGDNALLRGRSPQVRTYHGSARDEARTAVSLRRKLVQGLHIYLEGVEARAADLNVGVSEATRSRVPAVTRIIPCGVDLSRFKPGEKSEHPSILFVGTVGGRKRGSLLADMFQTEILPRHKDAELWVVADGPLPGPGVRNFGKVPLDRLADLYRRAWVFCLPSTYEGFGVPYIEALASGAAVIASPNPGACEVLSGGEFGRIVGDEALAGAISALLSSESERATLAKKGCLRAADFSWGTVAHAYEVQYLDLMSRANARRRSGQSPIPP